MTVPQILAHMSANTAGLQTYQVPVKIDAKIYKVIAIPVSMSGTRYFKAPDKEALKMNTVPSAAKAFQNVYASLGTPATWPATYDITECSPTVLSGRPVYQLRAVYKRQANVDHILLDVDASTFDPLEARWYYTNGASIMMNIEEQPVAGRFRLPAHEMLSVTFPQYRGQADVHYGSYVTNTQIPESIFTQP
jgi:hypothetical protein